MPEQAPLASVDPGGRLIAALPLERVLGCVVHVADDGDAAVALAAAVRPDLVVTTYPNRTRGGEPLASCVRRTPGAARVPVLNLASRVRDEELAEAAAAGVDESLPMPVCLAELLDAVERLAGRRGRAA